MRVLSYVLETECTVWVSEPLARQSIVRHKVLRNLDGIECCAFLDLVGYAPE